MRIEINKLSSYKKPKKAVNSLNSQREIHTEIWGQNDTLIWSLVLIITRISSTIRIAKLRKTPKLNYIRMPVLNILAPPRETHLQRRQKIDPKNTQVLKVITLQAVITLIRAERAVLYAWLALVMSLFQSFRGKRQCRSSLKRTCGSLDLVITQISVCLMNMKNWATSWRLKGKVWLLQLKKLEYRSDAYLKI